MKKNTLEQFPKNKDFTSSQLSAAQLKLRANATQQSLLPEESRVCKVCRKKLPITEFYVRDKVTGVRRIRCRDCVLKSEGVIELGKIRFANKLFDKGFRRCGMCKSIKPLSEFRKDKKLSKGYIFVCYECNHKNFRIQRETLGDSYVKNYIKRNNLSITLDEARKMILETREHRFIIDNQSFKTLLDFTIYVFQQYSIPLSTTANRIRHGYSENDCKLSQHEFQSMSVKKSYIKRSKIRLIIDDKEFFSKADFSKYLFETYSISQSATEQRLRKGYSEQKCMLSRNESYKISVKDSYRKKSKIRLIIDNKEFFSKADFAEYLFVTYSISKRATKQRLLHGYSEQECMLSLSEIRKIIAKRSIASKSTN
jgi:hypothetical protein